MTKVEINNYNNALAEVEVVLEHLDYEDYEKIPKNIIEAINKNKNSDYKYEYDENLDFEYWTMLPQTKAILFNIFRDYLATAEQKDFIIKKQRAERIKLDEEKAKKYNSDDIFKDRKKISIKNNQKLNETFSKELIEYNENIFKRFVNRIKRIFKRN